MKKTLPSGAELDITRAPFVTGHKLFKTVVREFKNNVQIKLGIKDGQSISDLAKMELSDDAINTVKDSLFTILSSDDVESVLWECMDRVRYNGKKVDRVLFDDENIQEDFFVIFKEVAVYNLIPFGRGLESLFPSALVQRFTRSLPLK